MQVEGNPLKNRTLFGNIIITVQKIRYSDAYIVDKRIE